MSERFPTADVCRFISVLKPIDRGLNFGINITGLYKRWLSAGREVKIINLKTFCGSNIYSYKLRVEQHPIPLTKYQMELGSENVASSAERKF